MRSGYRPASPSPLSTDEDSRVTWTGDRSLSLWCGSPSSGSGSDGPSEEASGSPSRANGTPSRGITAIKSLWGKLLSQRVRFPRSIVLHRRVPVHEVEGRAYERGGRYRKPGPHRPPPRRSYTLHDLSVVNYSVDDPGDLHPRERPEGEWRTTPPSPGPLPLENRITVGRSSIGR